MISVGLDVVTGQHLMLYRRVSSGRPEQKRPDVEADEGGQRQEGKTETV